MPCRASELYPAPPEADSTPDIASIARLVTPHGGQHAGKTHHRSPLKARSSGSLRSVSGESEGPRELADAPPSARKGDRDRGPGESPGPRPRDLGDRGLLGRGDGVAGLIGCRSQVAFAHPRGNLGNMPQMALAVQSQIHVKVTTSVADITVRHVCHVVAQQPGERERAICLLGIIRI